MEFYTLIIASILIVLASVYLKKKRGPGKHLPGPWCLPIVGYIPFMTKSPHVKLTQLSKIYGPVYTLKLGSQNTVVLCDFQVIKEALLDDAFFGRPASLPTLQSETSLKTCAFTGLPWKEQRRFCMQMLRNFCFGKTQMEEQMKEEIEDLLERMSEKKLVIMEEELAPSISNNISSLLFGKRLKYGDQKRQKLYHLLNQVSRFSGSTQFFKLIPWIGEVMNRLNIGNKSKVYKATEGIRKYISEEIKEHEATLDPNHIRDFLDAYILEIQKRSDDPNTPFQRDVLLDLCRVFFGAGTGTIKNTLDWLLLTVALYPEKQERIHMEIENVIGMDRFPSWQDRLDMPFTEAAISEIMRWKTVLPLNAVRYTLKDTELNGYFIPKHSHVLAVHWAVDNEEKLWGKDVHDYRPERFLSDDGTKVVKPEYLTPFSLGKRSCPGKLMAEMEVFLYTVAILQKFKLSLPPGNKADLEGILGTSFHPRRQQLRLELRKEKKVVN